MAPPPTLEHDYIGLSEALLSTMGTSHTLEDFKGTELRLVPPGSNSPDRKERPLLMLSLNKSCYGSGAKRAFSDAIDGSGKWVFAGGKGCDGEMGKGGVLFSPRGENAKEDAQEKVKNRGNDGGNGGGVTPAAKAQVVGWPPIRSYRKNSMAANPSKNNDDTEDKNGSGSLYVKVSMDGAPYLRKVDLRTLNNYKELSMALEKMFSCFTIGHCGSYGLPSKDGPNENEMLHGSEHVLTYEDKDGDWMLVGDVPWDMFTKTCKRLRIMKGSEAIGLAPRATEKGKTRK